MHKVSRPSRTSSLKTSDYDFKLSLKMSGETLGKAFARQKKEEPTMKKKSTKKTTAKKTAAKKASEKKAVTKKTTHKRNDHGYTNTFKAALAENPMTLADARKAVLKKHPDCKVNFNKTIRSWVAKKVAKVDKNGLIHIA